MSVASGSWSKDSKIQYRFTKTYWEVFAEQDEWVCFLPSRSGELCPSRFKYLGYVYDKQGIGSKSGVTTWNNLLKSFLPTKTWISILDTDWQNVVCGLPYCTEWSMPMEALIL